MIDGYKELTPVIYGENAIKYLYRAEKSRGGNLLSAALARPDGADLCDGGDAAVCDGRRGVFGFGRRACSGGTGADAWRLCSVGKGLLSYGYV